MFYLNTNDKGSVVDVQTDRQSVRSTSKLNVNVRLLKRKDKFVQSCVWLLMTLPLFCETFPTSFGHQVFAYILKKFKP